MDPLPIVLPSIPVPARRPPLPFAAAVVPVAAGVVLWLVSGSLYALCFAALGPLMIVASLLDGARHRRRERRRDHADSIVAWASAEEELLRRQETERAALWHRHPDVATCLAQPPLRGAEEPDAATEVVVGRGEVASAIRTSGGEDERGREFRRRSGILEESPVGVPLGRGVCVRGRAPQASSVARALVAQLCLRFSATQLVLVGGHLDDEGLETLPHARPGRLGGFRLGVAQHGEGRGTVDAMVWIVPAGGEVPEGITTVIDVTELRRASVRTPLGTRQISLEALSVDQAREIGRSLGESLDEPEGVPDVVALQELRQAADEHGLPAGIGRTADETMFLDIVADGPHAIVTGTTGTGKSELLAAWVTAMATANGPDRVSFVLADFKGGTAFEPLRVLRQVAAVITDLDEAGARRGVTSLTAEIRRREAVLAAAGARDIREVAMPRLVIVIDEFAALLHEYPDLADVFTDVAARGRALGMHLILGTQRAAGVVRDALAANCPLRVSLRVGDPSDSRLVIGTSAAAELPGGTESRGLAFVRRPQDAEPQLVRIARAAEEDVSRVAQQWQEERRPDSPWLPELPFILPLDAARAAETHAADTLVLGRADVPELQAQPQELLRLGEDRGLAILGASGAGRTSALRMLAAQHPQAIWVPKDPEAAWDVVASWTEGSARLPRLVLCDDLDLTMATLPPEYAQEWLRRMEQLLRAAEDTTFVIAAARASGGVSRLVEALPRRALLRMSSRVEHLAAGGEASGFLRDRPSGRARIGEREVQFAWVDDHGTCASMPPTSQWTPGPGDCAIVGAASPSVVALLRAAHPTREVLPLEPGMAVSGRGTILVADAETWLRNPTVWRHVRTEGEVLIRVENPADLRHLAGVRDLPPYARTHAGRAWCVRGEEAVRRVIIPAFAPQHERTAAHRSRRDRRVGRVSGGEEA